MHSMRRERFAAVVLMLSLVLALFGGTGGTASAGPPGRVDVIIAFTEAPGAAEEALVRGLGGTVKGTYTIVPAMAASIPAAAVGALERNPRVAAVEPDGEVQAFHLGDTDTTEVANAWGVDRLDANTLWGTANGSGVGVAIVDTGSGPHPDLRAALERWNCLSGTCVAGGNDDNGHGTHVAGSALALQNGTGVAGMAPAAPLFSYKVLNNAGNGNWSGVIAAVDHAVANNPDRLTKISVANFSFGSTSDPGTTVKAAFDNAYAAGVLLVAAAGNALIFSCNQVSYPARYDSVVAVGATDKSDKRPYYSCTGPQLELAAPGSGIYSTYLNNAYKSLSGTSMASPHVAGAAALVISAGPVGDTNGFNGIADEVRAKLTSTAKDLGAAGRDTQFGYGLVNPVKAVTGSNSHF